MSEQRFTAQGSQTVGYESFGDTREEAVAAFREEHGFMPDGWEDMEGDANACGEIIGACESCGEPIYDDVPYFRWSGDETVYTCQGCGGNDEHHKPVMPKRPTPAPAPEPTGEDVEALVERIRDEEIGGGEDFDCDVASHNAAVRNFARQLLAALRTRTVGMGE